MKPRSHLVLICIALLAAGCASAPASKPVASAPRPFADASQEISFHVFMGELASQRADPATAVKEYLAAARLSSDPTLSSHAALLAYGAGDDASALEAAERWETLAPGNRDAGHFVAVLKARAGDATAAAAEFEALVQAGTDRGYSPAAQLLEDETDAEHALSVLQRIVVDLPKSADAHFALAHAAMYFKRADLAESEAHAVLALDPHDDDAQVLLARALVAEGHSGEGLSLLHERLSKSGDDVTLRLAYAALLVQAERMAEAGTELEGVLKTHPNNVEALYTLGLLALQDKNLPAAHGYFERLLKTGRRTDDAYYFLGNTAELDRHYPEALDWYHRVEGGDRWLAAQAGIGRSLVQSGTPEAAEEFFNELVADDGDESVTLRLTEGQVFSDMGQAKLALKVYDDALGAAPEENDLLYARALLLEQDGDADAAERDLASILQRAPDDAEALNALGYMLTLHSTRYREAQGYIQKALKLQPDDPAIMDSMGWVDHRLGDETAALTYLKKAYAAQADPEIAAHLVEVLFATGARDDARDLLQKALRAAPDNAALRDLESRFKP